MKTFHESRRARFLKEILDAFDSEDLQKMMDLANETQVDFWPLQWFLDGKKELSARDLKALGEMERELKRLFGHGFSAEKLSVAPQWQNKEIIQVWQRCLDTLSPEAKQVFGSALEMMDLTNFESLDSHYAHEVVEILREIIERVGPLDKLPPLKLPNHSVQLAFEEAHQCYLYGFSKACVVLCRATVEYSLKEALGTTENDDSLDFQKFSRLMRSPKAKVLLGDLWDFAEEVRYAGNKAIHDAERFEDQYGPDKVQELLLKTRGIVEHLYPLPNG